MKVLTKVEIIEETAAFYNSNNRAIDNESCMYITSDGKKCALGRCLTEESLQLVHSKFEGMSALKIAESHDLDTLLLPQYRGKYGSVFWRDLQFLHDTAKYWNDEDINGYGIEFKETLLRRYNP
jgi:hypothetical protein